MDDQPRPRWIELRTASGKLACKYDPARRLIEYVHRGEKTLFDLTEFDLTETGENEKVAKQADM